MSVDIKNALNPLRGVMGEVGPRQLLLHSSTDRQGT